MLEREETFTPDLTKLAFEIKSSIPGYVPKRAIRLGKEIIPFNWDFKDTIFDTLAKAHNVCPQARNLIEAIYRREVELFVLKAGFAHLVEDDKVKSLLGRLEQAFTSDREDFLNSSKAKSLLERVQAMPKLEEVGVSGIFLNSETFFHLEHDITKPLDNLLYKLDTDLPQPSFQIFNDDRIKWMNIRYRLGRFKEISDLSLGYCDLLRMLAGYRIIPLLNTVIEEGIPSGNYELLEVRSGFRELVRMDPLTFAGYSGTGAEYLDITIQMW